MYGHWLANAAVVLATVGVVVACVLMLHVAGLWLFGATFWGLGRVAGTGHVVGADPLGLLDAVYMATMS